jgi:acyl carrier protein
MAEKVIKRRGIAVNVKGIVRRWLLADDAQRQMTQQATELKDQLKDILAEQGDEDDNGHRWIAFDEPVEGRITAIKREKRVSRVLNDAKAETYLRSRGLWDSCTEEITVVQINEDAILAKAFSGEISEEDLKEMYDVTETFAFVPQRAKR